MSGAQSPSAEPDLPVRPLLAELPLGRLAEDVFELFSAELAELLFPLPDAVHGYGSRGDKQSGIDVEVVHPEGPPTGIQCKRTEEFGPADGRDAVKGLTLDVRECIIFLSRKASPGARQEIAGHPGWQLWDRVDLSRKIRSLPDKVAAIRLVIATSRVTARRSWGSGNLVLGRARRRFSGRSAACRCSPITGALSAATGK